MSKISPNKLKQLIAKGRVTPVIQANDKGEYFLYGYRRTSKRSSKINENYMFAEPVPLEKKEVDSKNV